MAFRLKVPQMGESVVEGTIGKWFVEVGDKIVKDEPIVEIQTDKVNVEVPAETDGVMLETLVKVGDIVSVGQEIAVIGNVGEKAEAAGKSEPAKTEPKARAEPKGAPAPQRAPEPAAQTTDVSKMKLSPAVRRLLREHDVDVTAIKGSGASGRVTAQDVKDYVASGKAKPTVPSAKARPAPVSGEKVVEEVPISRVRGLIADHMVKSKRVSPHVTTFDECDFSHLVEFRKKNVDRIEKESGIRITYMPFIVKSTCMALAEFPYMNASMTEDKIILKKYYNIGIAVARESGLIVPVIKAADQKSILELMRDMKDVSDRARADKLTPADIEDGTFSITNAGGYGALNSTPIISQPQVAILGVHAIQKRPVVRDNQIVIRDMMNFGLSFDHRLIDGHYAVQFLRRLIEYLEYPESMLL
jgi:2-oxoglutarate dehydrogenase complex dihydrolipoamide succinyltransferase (E2) component